jgi:hypothetical protein
MFTNVLFSYLYSYGIFLTVYYKYELNSPFQLLYPPCDKVVCYKWALEFVLLTKQSVVGTGLAN